MGRGEVLQRTTPHSATNNSNPLCTAAVQHFRELNIACIAFGLDKFWRARDANDKRFTSYLVPLFQNESSCKACHIKMSLIYMIEPSGGTHFHMNRFVRGHLLTKWQKATQKWLIAPSQLKHVFCLINRLIFQTRSCFCHFSDTHTPRMIWSDFLL